jgi:cobalt-precorrin-5B (C1)-methyltransferase
MILETFKRFGITTGAAAAAASKAAALALIGNKVSSVTIPTPLGLRLEISVDEVKVLGDEACAKVRKFSGDNPDILDGIEIISCVTILDNYSDIIIEGEKGIGIVTRPGLKVEIGKKAINPVPLNMIKEAVREVIKDKGVKVVISIPKGEELADKTMNPLVGIMGGISILGTTGIETPVSDEDYIEHIRCELQSIKASSDLVVIAPGNTGALFANRLYPSLVVKVGDRIGDTIKIATKLGFKKIIIAGLPAKLIKLSVGILNTHNKYGDARIEALTHACVITNIPYEIIKKVSESLTVEEALSYLGEYKKIVFKYISAKILKLFKKFYNDVEFGLIIFDYNGEIISKEGVT